MMASLTTLVEEEKPGVVTKEASALPPEIAKEIAGRLRDAVEVGDVMEMTGIATELSGRDDASRTYGEKIIKLAEAFDFDGLIKLANSLEEEATH